MESNLGQFGETYNTGIGIATLIFFGLLLLRIYFVNKEIAQRSWLWKGNAPIFIWVLKGLWFLGMLCFLLDIPSWFLTLASFKSLIDPTIYLSFMLVLISIAFMEIILSFTVTQSVITQFIKRILFLLLSVFCAFSFGLAAFVFPGTFQFPAEEECTLLEMPVKGQWLAMQAGKFPWVNYHANVPMQLFALDMVKLGSDGKFFANMGADTSDFYSFGDSVFAPASGIVINSKDGLPTQMVYKGEDTVNVAGNFVEIEMQNAKYLFIAHLLKGSVAVASGDTIAVGQYLGLSGNSGNTTFPHLHLHIQDKPILNDTSAKGQPFRFNNIERTRFGVFKQKGAPYLNRNDIFSASHE